MKKITWRFNAFASLCFLIIYGLMSTYENKKVNTSFGIKLIENSLGLGLVYFVFVLFIVIFLTSYMIKELWNRLLCAKFPSLPQISLSEAYAFALLIGVCIG